MTRVVDSDKYDIRYTLASDKDFLAELMTEEHINKWLPIDQEVGVPLFSNNWVYFSKYKSALTCTYEGKPCAMGILFLMPYKKVAHMATVYLMVDPSMRNQGIGSSLLKNLLHLGKTYFRLESVHFELFGGSPLIPFLQKKGFQEVVRQPKYAFIDGVYHDRVVMEYQL